ncbi:RDD family protein [Paenibacillus antri]|uniref:RDD family protein n=1 Tax=Paenibacillus antri TaxID=2582848 RepID=A0A5R9G8X3_9BACL|nr:RDD family protein [Paenibacillus antri]TLS52867.1 RDD family protein [Paenibacillus antri]
MNASFQHRSKAFLLDYVLILAYLVILVLANVIFAPNLQGLFEGSPAVAQLSGFVMVTLPVSLYFIVCDSAFGGRSFGKRKTGIRVVAADGASLSVPRAAFRTMLKFLPWELSHYVVHRLVRLGDEELPLQYAIVGGFVYVLMFSYILTALFTKRKQSLYDILAKTQVVKESGEA